MASSVTSLLINKIHIYLPTYLLSEVYQSAGPVSMTRRLKSIAMKCIPRSKITKSFLIHCQIIHSESLIGFQFLCIFLPSK